MYLLTKNVQPKSRLAHMHRYCTLIYIANKMNHDIPPFIVVCISPLGNKHAKTLWTRKPSIQANKTHIQISVFANKNIFKYHGSILTMHFRKHNPYSEIKVCKQKHFHNSCKHFINAFQKTKPMRFSKQKPYQEIKVCK